MLRVDSKNLSRGAILVDKDINISLGLSSLDGEVLRLRGRAVTDGDGIPVGIEVLVRMSAHTNILVPHSGIHYEKVGTNIGTLVLLQNELVEKFLGERAGSAGVVLDKGFVLPSKAGVIDPKITGSGSNLGNG